MDLYENLKESYKPASEAKQNIAGYQLDNELSDINHKVYYNKDKDRDNRLLVTYRGSSNLNDFITDGHLAFGSLRNTKRYDESADVLRKAKSKYNEDKALITGHSLGGSIAKAVAKKDDKIISYNSGNGLFGANFNTKSNNIKNYRTNGDLVSIMHNPKTTKTLKNKNLIKNFINSHNLENIKKSGLTI